ncbi:MAG: Fic family protein, partial [Rhodothermia bacterium]
EHEFAAIIRMVRMYPAGASVGDLMRAPELKFARRTLKRRLRRLTDERRLIPRGAGRGRHYVLPEMPITVHETRSPYVRASDDGWLSDDAREIRDVVARPQSVRTPVGYKGDFLESYKPNETVYLPLELRRHLVEIGQVGMSDLPAGTYLRRVLNRLLIDLSWNSSRLEGNTYSLLETQRLIELGETAEGKAAQEARMILNHKAAIEMLAEQTDEIGFNSYTICNLHALLSDSLMADQAAGGRVRSHAVGITGTVFHPLEIPQAIEERFAQILEKAEAIENAFEQAFFVMVQIPYLQPFEDVNKRVSRLAANVPLMEHNLCPLSFIDVPQKDYIGGLLGVYELNRVEYLRDVFARAYGRSAARYGAVRQSLGEPDPFRIRYRSKFGQFVRDAVLGRMDKAQAARWIAQQAKHDVPEDDRAKFIEVVETELSSLHEGNIARFRLRPSEFEDWKSGWK